MVQIGFLLRQMKDDCLQSVMVHFGKLVYERFNRLQPGIVVWIHYSTKKKNINNRTFFYSILRGNFQLVIYLEARNDDPS